MMDTTWLTFNLGVQAFEARDYNAAVKRFSSVLDVDPGNTQVREYLARAYFHRASLPLAERELRVLLEHDPADDYATLLLARTLERQSRHDEAAAVRRRLAALTGDAGHLARHRPGS